MTIDLESNDIMRIVTSVATSTDASAAWTDRGGSDDVGGSAVSVDTATTAELVESPGVGTTRGIRSVTVANRRSSAAQVVRVETYDGATATLQCEATLLAGEALRYESSRGGWEITDLAGGRKTVGTSGPAGQAGPAGPTITLAEAGLVGAAVAGVAVAKTAAEARAILNVADGATNATAALAALDGRVTPIETTLAARTSASTAGTIAARDGNGDAAFRRLSVTDQINASSALNITGGGSGIQFSGAAMHDVMSGGTRHYLDTVGANLQQTWYGADGQVAATANWEDAASSLIATGSLTIGTVGSQSSLLLTPDSIGLGGTPGYAQLVAGLGANACSFTWEGGIGLDAVVPHLYYTDFRGGGGRHLQLVNNTTGDGSGALIVVDSTFSRDAQIALQTYYSSTRVQMGAYVQPLAIYSGVLLDLGHTSFPTSVKGSTVAVTATTFTVTVGGVPRFTATGTKPAAPTAANAGTINSGDATTDAVIANMRTRIGELEAALRSLTLIT